MYFLSKPYDVTQLRGHNFCFYAELTKIIPNYHLILPLIYSSEQRNLKQHVFSIPVNFLEISRGENVKMTIFNAFLSKANRTESHDFFYGGDISKMLF